MSMFQEALPKEEETIPADTQGFLRWLHRRWPHQCPEPGTPPEEIYRYAGARALVDAMMFRVLGPDKDEW